jgi:hypothetical protein
MAHLQVEVTQPEDLMPGELDRISLDVYRRIADLGLIDPSDRVELLDGLLVMKPARGSRHVTVTHLIAKLLQERLPAGWYPRKEDPIELPGGTGRADSSPEPDVAVVRGTFQDYNDRHPTPGDIGLVIEVADSPEKLAHDGNGLARAAWSGLPVVWIVNLANETVEVYAGPSGSGPNPRYATSVVKRVGDELSVVLGDSTVTIPAASIIH